MSLAQSGIDAPGGVILGTTQLIEGCNVQAWMPPSQGASGFAHHEPIEVTPLNDMYEWNLITIPARYFFWEGK